MNNRSDFIIEFEKNNAGISNLRCRCGPPFASYSGLPSPTVQSFSAPSFLADQCSGPWLFINRMARYYPYFLTRTLFTSATVTRDALL